MIKNLVIFFLFFSFLVPNYGHAQATEASQIQTKLDHFLQSTFQEKLYVHTDRNTYLCGETLWFKIYNVEAYTNRSVNVSKVAYIEILDEDNKPLLQCKVALKDGKGEGSLYIPVATKSGNYRMRGYTNWMKNFDPSFYFHKDISIYNTLLEEPTKETEKANPPYAIQFFPESGNLVAGLTSNVAFKAVNADGVGIDFKAVLLNSTNDTIVKFKPSKFGIGKFSFTPESGQKYNVLVQPVDGDAFNASLPQIFREGAVMTIKPSSGNKLNISLQNNRAQNENFTLLVRSGQKTVFTKTLSGSDALSLPLDILGDGISQFTLFDQREHPVCERLYFKKPLHLLALDLAVDKKTYQPREKVQLSVSQSDANLPLGAGFSVSVFKSEDSTKTEDIVANLWLTSELKGKIENANWYIKSGSAEALDNLMLTHGWRRFKWEDVVTENKQQFKFLPEVEGHIISGQLTNTGNDAPLENRIVFLSVPGKRFQFYTSSSNHKGEVNFYTKNFYGGKELVVQTDFRTDSLSSIEIKSPFSNQFTDASKSIFSKRSAPVDLLKRSVAMQVNNAYYAKYFTKETVPFANSPTFYEKADKAYKLDDYVRFTTMEEVLREYVSEIMVTIRKKNFNLNIFNNDVAQFHDSAPLLLIDGIPIFDEGNALMKMDPRKIERLEIVSSNYLYGRNRFSGIASFTSYKGDFSDYSLPKKALVVDYEALQNQREFYSPMYNGDDMITNRLPDYRTTLFWSPDNKLQSNKNSELSFFTSDLEGDYIIEVQALSADGRVGSAHSSLKIDKATNQETK